MTSLAETYRRAFPDEDIPHISYGLSFPQSCKKHAEETFKSSRVYIIASKTLSNNTDALTRLKDALQDRVVGVRVGMTPHTLWSECLEVTEECRKLDVDLLITLGAGSLTDAAKIVSLVGLTGVRCVEIEYIMLTYTRLLQTVHQNLQTLRLLKAAWNGPQNDQMSRKPTSQ
jgi:alcohol dehydrogenase class IV